MTIVINLDQILTTAVQAILLYAALRLAIYLLGKILKGLKHALVNAWEAIKDIPKVWNVNPWKRS